MTAFLPATGHRQNNIEEKIASILKMPELILLISC